MEEFLYPLNHYQQILKNLEPDCRDQYRFGPRKAKKGIWLKIPIEKSLLIHVAVEEAFHFHHAQKTFLMLSRWLSSERNSLPNYASFFVGVGGFVVNERNEILVVQEKNGPLTQLWKLPGGAVDPNENISDGAMREVFEETGIQTSFLEILCFRQANHFNFSLPDLYFVVKLKPLTQEIRMQEEEIKDCRWMPMDEFFSIPFYRGVYRKMLDLERESLLGKYRGFSMESLPMVYKKGENQLYFSKL